jgi:hypothetical protein
MTLIDNTSDSNVTLPYSTHNVRMLNYASSACQFIFTLRPRDHKILYRSA